MSLARAVTLSVALAVLPSAAPAQDAAEMVVRIGRLENQLREMAGQIEVLQHENRRLAAEVKKFQEDVEFRFQERGVDRSGGTRTQAQSGSPTSSPGRQAGTQQGSSQQAVSQQNPQAQQAGAQQQVARRATRGDAFDPASNPNAQGAPKQLGARDSASREVPPQNIPRGAVQIDDTAPVEDATPGGRARADVDSRPLDIQGKDREPRGQQQARPGPNVATGSGDPRADYEGAYALVLQKRYDQAEMSFRAFLQSHPRDKLVPEATFWLGESFLQRRRYREAAEQFLKVATEHGTSTHASSGMLKLGMALNGMGERDKACGTFGEVLRKYPNMRDAVEREKRAAKC